MPMEASSTFPRHPVVKESSTPKLVRLINQDVIITRSISYGLADKTYVVLNKPQLVVIIPNANGKGGAGIGFMPYGGPLFQNNPNQINLMVSHILFIGDAPDQMVAEYVKKVSGIVPASAIPPPFKVS